MLTESQKLSIALMLFGLAIFCAGIKGVNRVYNYHVAKEVTTIIRNTLHFIDQSFPSYKGIVRISFRLGNVTDTITVNRYTNRITSARHFKYRYKGVDVDCSVQYLPNEKQYLISCGAE